MKIMSNKNIRPRVIAALTVVLLTGGYLVFAYYNRTMPFNSLRNDDIDNVSSGVDAEKRENDINYSAPTEEQQQAPVEADSIPGTNDNSGTSIGVAITAAQQDVEGNLQVRAIVQDLSSSGMCKLILEGPFGKIIEKEAETQPMSNSATCKGFTIQSSELNSGEWTIKLEYMGADSKAGSASQKVSIK